jgi:hypothetical protein
MIISRVVSTLLNTVSRRIVKVKTIGSNVETGVEASPYGIDSNPVKGMIALYGSTGIKGEEVIVGYLNQDNLAAVGETRLYSTDSDGNLQTYVWLKNDGTMELGGNAKHLARFEELKSGFDTLKADFNAHVHASNGVPPTTPSIASIDTSKTDNVKTA